MVGRRLLRDLGFELRRMCSRATLPVRGLSISTLRPACSPSPACPRAFMACPKLPVRRISTMRRGRCRPACRRVRAPGSPASNGSGRGICSPLPRVKLRSSGGGVRRDVRLAARTTREALRYHLDEAVPGASSRSSEVAAASERRLDSSPSRPRRLVCSLRPAGWSPSPRCRGPAIARAALRRCSTKGRWPPRPPPCGTISSMSLCPPPDRYRSAGSTNIVLCLASPSPICATCPGR